MKLICSIIERCKARQYITTHICSPWRCSWSRHKSQDMSQDVTPLEVRSSDELRHEMTLRKQKITKHSSLKTQQTTIKFSSRHSSYARCQPSDPQGKNSLFQIFISKNVSQCSQKQLEDKTYDINTILLPLKRANDARGPLMRMHA